MSALRLRRPRGLFAVLAAGLFFGITLGAAAYGAQGFSRIPLDALGPLSLPSAIALTITARRLGAAAWRGAIAGWTVLLVECAVAGAVTGAVWPLSVQVRFAIDGGPVDWAHGAGLAGIGALLGAGCTLVAGLVAGLVSLTRA